MHTLGEITEFIDAKLVGDPSIKINGIASLQHSNSNQLSYIVNDKYKKI
jgi:UDP-3-O-[3-hydroxymyristoyl] glucosamine N-acyltransferase (EC 2.3.1.-)